MSDSKLENDCGLIIDPALLADIQAACRRRAAVPPIQELEGMA